MDCQLQELDPRDRDAVGQIAAGLGLDAGALWQVLAADGSVRVQGGRLRALSVVRYMVERLDIPPGRLSANGFGEYQPIDRGDNAQARAQNRRIELKFTEK